ncbi:MAG: hypothetical protein JW882_13460 [Deltaproteobacteria bacterium]|nr:hypothetical protein [Deltaproteobacteria bacterium]
MESWRIFAVASKRMDRSILWNIWRKVTPDIEKIWAKKPKEAEDNYKSTVRMIQKWAADPRNCAETSRNPLDRIRLFLDELDSIGEGKYARAAIDYMAEPLGGCFAYKEDAVSDKCTIDGEATDALIALGNLMDKLREDLIDGVLDDKMKAQDLARYAKRQIDEILAAAIGRCK